MIDVTVVVYIQNLMLSQAVTQNSGLMYYIDNVLDKHCTITMYVLLNSNATYTRNTNTTGYVAHTPVIYCKQVEQRYLNVRGLDRISKRRQVI